MELHVKLNSIDVENWKELTYYLFGDSASFVKNPDSLRQIMELALLAKEKGLKP